MLAAELELGFCGNMQNRIRSAESDTLIQQNDKTKGEIPEE